MMKLLRIVFLAAAAFASATGAHALSASSIPTKIPTWWGESASGSYITCPVPIPSQVGITAGRASWTTGFPPLNFTNVSAGGIPPFGQDMNGAFCQISQWTRWYNAGGSIPYDPTFQSAIGGYPNGAIVGSVAFPGVYWMSQADNNASDPDTGGANWTRMTMASPLAMFNGVSASGSSQSGVWTISQITASTSLGGIPYFGSSLSLSFSGSTTGANGMDTGSMPTSADISIYAIYNPTTNTWATLGYAGSSLNNVIYPGSHMPSGYTASCLIYAGVTTAGSNFNAFTQADRTVWLFVTIGTGLSATTPTSISLANIIPAAAKTWFPIPSQTGGGSAAAMFLSQTSTNFSTSIGKQAYYSPNGAGAEGRTPPVPISTAQQAYYEVSSGSTWELQTNGYTF